MGCFFFVLLTVYLIRSFFLYSYSHLIPFHMGYFAGLIELFPRIMDTNILLSYRSTHRGLKNKSFSTLCEMISVTLHKGWFSSLFSPDRLLALTLSSQQLIIKYTHDHRSTELNFCSNKRFLSTGPAHCMLNQHPVLSLW